MKTAVLLCTFCVGVWLLVTGGNDVNASASTGLPQRMTAAFYDDYGAPLDVMNVRETDVPTAGRQDVLIKVKSAALNPVDYKIIGGGFKLISPWILAHPPKVPGFDVAGVVAAVGSGVTGFSVGDEVFAMADFRRCGTLAEYVAVEADLVVAKPAGLSWDGAASLPLVATTGYKALVDIANVQPGQSVLILGASGGTGSFGVQLAKALGATVVATSGARNMDRVASLGADEVLDYRSTNWGVTLAGRDFDVVYDCIGGYRHWLDGLRVLRSGGHYVTIVGDIPGNSLSNLIAKGWAMFTRKSWFSGVHYTLFTAFPSGRVLSAVADHVNNGDIQPIVDSTFPLARAPQAMEKQRQGHANGKIVVVVDGDSSAEGQEEQVGEKAVEVAIEQEVEAAEMAVHVTDVAAEEEEEVAVAAEKEEVAAEKEEVAAEEEEEVAEEEEEEVVVAEEEEVAADEEEEEVAAKKAVEEEERRRRRRRKRASKKRGKRSNN